MSDTWEERFSAKEYYYGIEPNVFFRNEIEALEPGRLLTLGEGEGRNAVFAARQGWTVDAVDQSTAGREKARALARRFRVEIGYSVGDLAKHSIPERTYDVVALIFVHLPDEVRARVHRAALAALRPGGRLILEAYSKEQVRFASGGPKDPALLYTTSIIAADFPTLKSERLEQVEDYLEEGPHHHGTASLVRFVGVAP